MTAPPRGLLQLGPHLHPNLTPVHHQGVALSEPARTTLSEFTVSWVRRVKLRNSLSNSNLRPMSATLRETEVELTLTFTLPCLRERSTECSPELEPERGASEDEMDTPKELVAAIEAGELTDEQLRQLITLEARELGLTFDEAVRRAKERSLPGCHLGSDLGLLIEMLPA